jgi:hypothetical protein
MAGIGTGIIRTAYMRPRLEELDKADLDKRLERYGGGQLIPNMWKVRTTKSYILRGAWITEVVLKRGNKYYTFQIPTDKNGNVNQITMAERLLDTESGDRNGGNRNVMVDCSVDALIRAEPKDQARVYNWFLYPNETDVKFIDDSKTKIVEILKSGKNGTGESSRILIVGGTEAQRETVAANISNNFTVREKGIINSCLIEIVPDTRSYAGCFIGNSDSSGNPIGTPKIIVTTSHVAHADVIVHEAIHALRQFDPNRDEKLKAVKRYFGKDADLEESLTEAETTGREVPFRKDYKAGYYHYIKIPNAPKLAGVPGLNLGNKTSMKMVTEDRVTITGEVEKGMKGKRVQKAIILKYPLTNIAHLKLKGAAEAIDTYYEVGNRIPGKPKTGEFAKTNIHLYNPSATPAVDDAVDHQLKAETSGGISQWEDGQRRKIQDPKFRRPSATTGGAKPGGGKPKTSHTKQSRYGPYFHKTGRLSRHKI